MDFKIDYKECTYEEFVALEPIKHLPPKSPNRLLRSLAWGLSVSELKKTHFKYKKIGMERLGKNEPALILMNHSAFLDFQIAMHVFRSRKINIVTGLGGCICKERVMRHIGCIPTRKFTTDFALVKDMKYCIKTLKTSVLMYPEADYSYSGLPHTLPSSLGGLVKLLGAPLVVMETFGAFINDPIYRKLKPRNTPVSAEVRYVLSPEEIKQMSAEEIDAVIKKEFTFDGFRWQQENKLVIDDPNRAKDLDKILYKCPHCQSEGYMKGAGTKLTCHKCGKEWELTELGFMKAISGETEFDHIPNWFEWQRECVRQEVLDGKFLIETPVNLYGIVNTKAMYILGKGNVRYDKNGIRLVAYDGKLDFYKSSISMYAIGADLQWPIIGDGMCFGDNKVTYFASPVDAAHLVVKARLASEEIYKILKKQ